MITAMISASTKRRSWPVLRLFRAQYDALLIFITDLKVEVAPDHQQAQAVLIAKVLAKARGALSESEVRSDRYRIYFRRTDGGWKMTRSNRRN